MHLCIRARAMATTAIIEAYKYVYLADEGVEPNEGMEAVEIQLVCVSLPFFTDKHHGASSACIIAFQAFQHIQKQQCL